MKRALATCAALAAAVRLASPAAAEVKKATIYSPDSSFHNKVIYGADTRVDVYQTSSERRALADSTVALFQDGSITATDDGRARLATQNFGQAMNLCREEPFYEQGTGAFCTGSLVAPDVIMTAGHCVTTADDCAKIKFVFGFAVKEKGVLPDSVAGGEVYGCKELIARDQQDEGADWALVRLDRKVGNHAPLKLNLAGKIEKQAEVFVIGHPSGLPTKIADGAHVRDASNDGFFVANLDTYGGNSGSPVFNAATGLVEGILVRGEQDFVKKGACMVSNVCPADGCRGEDVTKISNVADKIPAAENELHLVSVQRSVAEALASLGAEARP